MRNLIERYLRPPRESDGGAGGAGGGDPGAGGGGGGWTPPEGLPADLAGANADETLARLLPAYTEASTRMNGLRTQVAQMPKAPDSIDAYTFDPDEKLKPYFEGFDQDPAWKHAREAALAAGVSKDQLSKLVTGIYGPMAEAGLIAPPFNPSKEIDTFMTAGGFDRAGAQSALTEAETFAKGLAGQLKGVPENVKAEAEAMLMTMTDTAAGNFLLRAISGRLAENGIRIAGDGVGQGALTEADLKKLDADPRIDPANRNHADPAKRYDEDLRRRYDEAYRNLPAKRAAF